MTAIHRKSKGVGALGQLALMGASQEQEVAPIGACGQPRSPWGWIKQTRDLTCGGYGKSPDETKQSRGGIPVELLGEEGRLGSLLRFCPRNRW